MRSQNGSAHERQSRRQRRGLAMKAILMAGTMLAMMGTANSASFYRGQIIGEINYGDEKEFNAMVATYPPKTKIYLNSPGGNVTAGLAIAATIQALALDTV